MSLTSLYAICEMWLSFKLGIFFSTYFTFCFVGIVIKHGVASMLHATPSLASNLVLFLLIKVAIKIIDKTQLNPSSLQKVLYFDSHYLNKRGGNRVMRGCNMPEACM